MTAFAHATCSLKSDLELVDACTLLEDTEVEVDGIKNGHIYAGRIGIDGVDDTDGFDPRGHSVSFSAGDRAGFVTVNLSEGRPTPPLPGSHPHYS